MDAILLTDGYKLDHRSNILKEPSMSIQTGLRGVVPTILRLKKGL